jgi:hypothetical protein
VAAAIVARVPVATASSEDDMDIAVVDDVAAVAVTLEEDGSGASIMVSTAVVDTKESKPDVTHGGDSLWCLLGCDFLE